MGLFDEISKPEKEAAVTQIAKGFDVREDDLSDAFEKLVPALAGGMKRKMEDEEGLDDLVDTLQNQRHERYIEQPETLTRQETVNDGNQILEKLFGSKQVSREVAERAAQQTKLSPEILKKLLPIIATMSMGALKKRAQKPQQRDGGESILERARKRTQSLQQRRSSINDMLDADGDGSIVDDILERMRRR